MKNLPDTQHLVVFPVFILMLAKIGVHFKHNLDVNTFSHVEHNSAPCYNNNGILGIRERGFILVSVIRRNLLRISVVALAIAISSSCVFASTSTTKVNNKKYTHPSFYKTSLYRLFHGVDVSYWQHEINWDKSKADGIDFAIMRCGYTALNKFSLHQDSTFLTNYKKATEAGVSVGIYYYACATTTKEAKKEANYVISILKNNNINNQLPVVMDYEIDSGRANSTYKSIVKKKGKSSARKTFTKNAVTFMNTLRASGYEPMFYSYRVMIDPNFSSNYRFNMKDINGSSQYRFWLAQYSTSISYTGNMEIWQFTSTGRVNGMSGNIDRNFWYYPLEGTKTEEGTRSIRKCAVTLSSTAYKYDGKAKRPKVTVKYGDDTLKDGTDYAVSYMDNIKKGTATVLVHGKGDYSNETYTTFKIGDKADTTNKTTVLDTSALTPKEIKDVKTKVDVDEKTLSVSWDKAKNANKYQVVYKINGAEKWTKKTVSDTSYTLKDLEPGSIVALKIRGRNTVSEDAISGPYSEVQRRYIGGTDNTCEVGDDLKAVVKWKESKDDRGKFSYKVSFTAAGGKTKSYTVEGDQKSRTLKADTVYDITVTPSLITDKNTYTGTAGKTTTVYTGQTEITGKKALKGGFTLEWKKVTGEGNLRYKIMVADNKKMKDFQYMTKKQKVTSVTIENLSKKTKYYVAIMPYIKIDGKAYYGSMSKVVGITTK